MSADCGCGGTSGCGCCAGVQALTPATIVNRPGLSQISYRVGTHGSFMATMRATLSGAAEPALNALTTRSTDDPCIAFLDCWATVADILIFYQERIANEGYLRTATELRSVLELARLVGYQLRPGLGASAYLAYTLQANPAKVTTVTIAQGSQAASVPGPGQQPQTFETSDDLIAQQPWNTLPVRATTPAVITAELLSTPPVQVPVQGGTLAITPGNRLVFATAQPGGPRVPMSVQAVSADATAQVTTLTLLPDPAPTAGVSAGAGAPPAATASDNGALPLPNLVDLISPLQVPPSVPPADSAHLARTVSGIFGAGSDIAPQLLVSLAPSLGSGLYQAWGQTAIPAPDTALPAVSVQRAKAGVFGATAPLKPVPSTSGAFTGNTQEWPLSGSVIARIDVVADATSPTVTVSANDGRQGSTTFLPAEALPADPVTLLPEPGQVSVSVTAPELGLGAAAAPGGTPLDLTFTFSGTISASVTISSTYLLASPSVIVDDHSYAPTPGQALQNSGQTEANVVSLSATGITPVHLSIIDEIWNAAPDPGVIDLDAEYDRVVAGSWAVVERADTGAVVTAQVLTAQTVARSAYGISGKVTRLTLDQPWLAPEDVLLAVARNTAVYVQSDPLSPARVADPTPVSGDSFGLDGLYSGLQTGRWLIITGERTDLPGVTTGEVVMVAGVTQGADLPGDTVHTTVHLSTRLAYSYVRSTVTIWGNVVAATQGATQQDVLGSGSASQASQSFALSRSPLTYLPAPTASGAASTLDTSVNGVSWQEVSNLVSAGPADHVYMTQTDDTGKTTVLFGDGVHGARLPTGAANVTASYRAGLGTAGNVPTGQISQPQTRPQGVQGVTNPLPSSGGADPDTAASARGNAPLAVMALDRVVSVQDYQDFARALAGVGKASSVLLSDGTRQFVHLTIGGTTEQPVETSSALMTNLVADLAANGDPHLPVRVAPCQVNLIVLTAGVHLGPGYHWSGVSAGVRAALLSAYSYDNRSLGQDVVLSDIVAAIQGVPGVDYAGVTGLTVVSLADPASTVQTLTALAGTLSAQPPARIAVPLAMPDPSKPYTIDPAQIAILSPDVPDSIVLTQITP